MSTLHDEVLPSGWQNIVAKRSPKAWAKLGWRSTTVANAKTMHDLAMIKGVGRGTIGAIREVLWPSATAHSTNGLPSYHSMLAQFCDAFGIPGCPTWPEALERVQSKLAAAHDRVAFLDRQELRLQDERRALELRTRDVVDAARRARGVWVKRAALEPELVLALSQLVKVVDAHDGEAPVDAR